MVRISKHPLSQQDIQRLEKQFARIIARLNTTTSDPFMSDLLGTEEKIMLLKRLAAIVMYHEGYSSYKVWTTLKISPDTANVIRTKFTQGQYANIQKQFTTHKTDYKQLWSTIETILGAGMPPMAGPGRWGNNPAVRGTRSKKK